MINSNTNDISSIAGLFARAKFARTKFARTNVAWSSNRARIAAGVGIAAVTALGTTAGFGAISTITSITTTMVSGSSSSQTALPGVGASYSLFQSPNTYNVSYAGNDQKLTSVTANGTTYAPSAMASAVVERGSNGTNTDNIWFVGSSSGSNISLKGPKESSLVQAFGGNNMLVGADNLFSNTGNSVGNNTNIARLDMLFPSGFKSSTSLAFAVLDRGPTGDHDAFKVAAITALDSNGNPANYGTLFSIGDGAWGTTNLMPDQTEIILRKNNSSASNPFDPSDSTGQAIGGVLIPTSNLVPAGTTVYGYSLFSAVANGSGSQLVDYTNKTYFPSADSTSTGGGLDPVGTSAVLFSTAVPEPKTLSLAGIAALALLGRRRRKADVK